MFNHQVPRNNTRTQGRTAPHPSYPHGQGARGADPQEQALWTAIGLQRGQWAKLRTTINTTFQKDTIVRLQGVRPVPTDDSEGPDTLRGPPQTTPNPFATHLVQVAAPLPVKETIAGLVTSSRETKAGLSVPQNYLSIANPSSLRSNPAPRNAEAFHLQQLVYLAPPQNTTRPFIVEGLPQAVTVKTGTRVRVIDYLTPAGHQVPLGKRPTNYKVETCLEIRTTRLVECKHWISLAFLEFLSPEASATAERRFRGEVEHKGPEYNVVSFEQ